MTAIKIGLCLISTFFIVIGFIANGIHESSETGSKGKIIVMGLYSLAILSIILVLILEV